MMMQTDRRDLNRTRPPHGARGFTLIELLVVISILALLISILLPSLQKAREQAKAVACATNTHHVANAVATYLADNKGTFPPSYVYPHDRQGNWSPTRQNEVADHPYGYVHWSHFLYDDGQVDPKAFQCPTMENGGAPRTNPGDDRADWESEGQIDQTNSSNTKSEPEDKQAPRMAYGANAAIMPRNKFTIQVASATEGSQGRINVTIRDSIIKRPGDTILLAEFVNNWKALGQTGAGGSGAGGVLSKSHRPINVFYHVSTGFNEYQAPPTSPGFIYGVNTGAYPRTEEDYGVVPLAQLRTMSNILSSTSNASQINAVGRHHPGGDKKYGGTANFLFTDGHTERMTPLETLKQRKWGDKYYTLTGESQVLNYAVRP